MYRKTSTHLEPPPSSSNRHRHLSDSTRRRSGTVDTPVTIPEEGRIRRVSEGDERERHDSGSSTRSACSSKSADDHFDHLDSGKSSTCSVQSKLCEKKFCDIPMSKLDKLACLKATGECGLSCFCCLASILETFFLIIYTTSCFIWGPSHVCQLTKQVSRHKNVE